MKVNGHKKRFLGDQPGSTVNARDTIVHAARKPRRWFFVHHSAAGRLAVRPLPHPHVGLFSATADSGGPGDGCPVALECNHAIAYPPPSGFRPVSPHPRDGWFVKIPTGGRWD